jgi:tol-pal system protein YbgF
VAGAGGNAEQLWAVAREQHQRGSFSTAQRAYAQFLEEYPSHPLAPEAHFFLADILAQQDRPEDAIDAFLEIQRLYPTASRVPDALFRVAILQRDLGNTGEARTTLERIINTYPDAPMALLARDLLEEIG